MVPASELNMICRGSNLYLYNDTGCMELESIIMRHK